MENTNTQLSNEVKQPDTLQTMQTNFEGIGADLADVLINTESELFKTRRASVSEAVKKASGHKTEFLNGYAKRFQELTGCKDSVRDTRKSEQKAIFEALTQADTESLKLIESVQDWHGFVKACRTFNSSNISLEDKEKREAKAIENKAKKEAQKQAELEAKKQSPLDDAELLQFSEFIPRLTSQQIDLYLTILGEVKTAKVKAEAEAKAKAEAEAKELAKQQEKERQEKVKALEEALKALKAA